ncbi:pyrroloquinoline quinone biosynthesis peptide chaperone PqqD [Rhodobacteraceae bacterium DSL-40]|uniref:pyrroloquinoline quinone biosynthesis peptide chaperone PqqD n=1 Tax=Amaricoccus sp. B4 TaxID=3368557 RepID=UPI000DAD8A67
MSLAAASVPRMPRGVRLQEDRVRGGWVLLAPERAIALDAVGLAIISRIDGARDFGAIVADLSETYGAPEAEIARDSGEFIAALAERRILEIMV